MNKGKCKIECIRLVSFNSVRLHFCADQWAVDLCAVLDATHSGEKTRRETWKGNILVVCFCLADEQEALRERTVRTDHAGILLYSNCSAVSVLGAASRRRGHGRAAVCRAHRADDLPMQRCRAPCPGDWRWRRRTDPASQHARVHLDFNPDTTLLCAAIKHASARINAEMHESLKSSTRLKSFGWTGSHNMGPERGPFSSPYFQWFLSVFVRHTTKKPG